MFFPLFTRITFDCFGPAIDLAHYLEAQSKPGMAHICSATKKAVEQDFEFIASNHVEHVRCFFCKNNFFLTRKKTTRAEQ